MIRVTACLKVRLCIAQRATSDPQLQRCWGLHGLVETMVLPPQAQHVLHHDSYPNERLLPAIWAGTRETLLTCWDCQ